MNERIQELIQKMDWEEMGADLWGKTHDGCMTTYALKKFSELIVQECIEQVKDFYQEDELNCFNAAEKIKDHFGVKS
jgi:hypothetical protein